MKKTANIEVYALIDECGDYVVSNDETQLKEMYEDNIQPIDGTFGIRIVKLIVTVPLPTPIEIAAIVQADETDPTVTVS